MTPERIAEIRELCKSATPPPWGSARGDPPFAHAGDLAFIIQSRQIIPDLLDDLDAIRDILRDPQYDGKPQDRIEAINNVVEGRK